MVALYYGGAKRDPYGRALAQVRRLKDQAWLQGELLRAGWARVWTFADNRALASAMLADEARARAKGAGLWAMPDYKVLLPNEVGAAQHGFQIVEGRVLAVTEGKSGTFLDFSPDPAGFAVVIAPKDLPVLRAGGISPQAMASRLIRVRGVIGWGGVMSVDHPEQVEQLRSPEPSRSGGLGQDRQPLHVTGEDADRLAAPADPHAGDKQGLFPQAGLHLAMGPHIRHRGPDLLALEGLATLHEALQGR